MAVQFISTTKLKALTTINENVDDKLLVPVILECQTLYILPLIGSGVYNDLVAQISAAAVSADYKNLLDNYIIPCLVSYIKAEAPVELNYKLTNKNVSKNKGENSDPVSADEMNSIIDHFKNKAQVYAERTTLFLRQNYQLYPKYYAPGSGWDVVYPNGTNYSCGIFLDDDSIDQRARPQDRRFMGGGSSRNIDLT